MKSITKEVIVDLISTKQLKLHPSQPSLFAPIIDRFFRKIRANVSFPPIKVVDDLIIEGHHRYIASILANKEISTIPSLRPSATTVKSWKSIKIEEIDPSSPEEIQKFNIEDAKILNMPLENFNEILSKS